MKKYKIKKTYRVTVTGIAILVSLSVLNDLYTSYTSRNSLHSFSIYMIWIGCALGLLYIAMKSNSLIYLITDDEIIVRSFLKIEKHYPLREISTIELHGILFPSIYIYLSTGKKITLLPIDDEKEFLSALTERLKKYGTAWTFIKRDEEW